MNRGVAQFGRAPRSGRGGRKFESCRLDDEKNLGISTNVDFPRFFNAVIPERTTAYCGILCHFRGICDTKM